MIHGCRPTSVTTQPASMAMKPNGAVTIKAHSRLRSSSMRALDNSLQPLHSAIAAMSIPQATMS